MHTHFEKSSVINKRYRIEDIIGEGGMGVVYKARDILKAESLIALKTIKPGLLKNTSVLKIFKKEYEIMTRLKHPNLVDVYLFGHDAEKSCYYITMEYLSGRTLKAVLTEKGLNDTESCIRIMVDLLRGLDFIHSRDIVYRDIKPSNIILTKDRVKYTDFGISDLGEIDHSKVKGSISYIAPEVLLKKGDYRVDIYSLGIVFLEMLTKHTLFSETVSISEIIDILSDNLLYNESHEKNIKNIRPHELGGIIGKMTAFDPERRYRSCIQIINEINQKLDYSIKLETKETKDAYVMGVAFTDRKNELEMMKDVLEKRSGKDRLHILSSNQGYGKSMIFKELKKHCMLQGIPFYEAECSREVKIPFFAVNQILIQVMHLLNPFLSEKYRKLGEELGITRPEKCNEVLIQNSSEERHDILVQSVANLLLDYRQQVQSTVVLYFDNIHWLDKQSSEVMARMMLSGSKGGKGSGSLKIFASINNEALSCMPAALMGIENRGMLMHWELEPFRKEETMEYISNVFGRNNIKESFIDDLRKYIRISGGNPFFLSEFIKYAIKNGIIDRVPGGWQFNEDLENFEIPDNIQDILTKRVISFLSRKGYEPVLKCLGLLRIPLPFTSLCQMFHEYEDNDISNITKDLEKYELIKGERVAEIDGIKLVYQVSNNLIRNIIRKSTDDYKHYHALIAASMELLSCGCMERYADEIAYHYDKAGYTGKAVDYILKSADILKKRSKDPEILLNYYNRALKLALQSYSHCSMKIYEIYRCLADTCLDAGKFSPALDFYSKASRIACRCQGEKSSAHVDILLKESRVYLQLGDFSQVLKRLDEAGSVCRYKSSENRSHIPEILMLKGDVFLAKSDYALAKDHFSRSLDIFSEQFGLDALETTAPLNCLGNVHFICGEFNKALHYYNKALNLQSQHSGRENIELCSYYINIATVLLHQGRYRLSLKYFKKVLNIQKSFYRGSNTNIAKAFNNIGVLYYKLRDYEKALKYYRKSLDIRRDIFGENHEQTADSLMNIGLIYFEDKKYELALDYYTRAHDIYLSFFGELHLKVSYCRNSIGYVYHSRARYEEALDNFQKALDIRKKLFGEDHPSIGESYDSMGDACIGKKDYKKAITCYRKAFEIISRTLGNDHPNTAVVLSNLARAFYAVKDYEPALKDCRQAWEINVKKFGKTHPETRRNYGFLLEIMKECRTSLEIEQFMKEHGESCKE